MAPGSRAKQAQRAGKNIFQLSATTKHQQPTLFLVFFVMFLECSHLVPSSTFPHSADTFPCSLSSGQNPPRHLSHLSSSSRGLRTLGQLFTAQILLGSDKLRAPPRCWHWFYQDTPAACCCFQAVSSTSPGSTELHQAKAPCEITEPAEHDVDTYPLMMQPWQRAPQLFPPNRRSHLHLHSQSFVWVGGG